MNIKTKKAKKPKKINVGEANLAFHLRAYRISFEAEYKFHPTRRWRLDFAIVDEKLGVEIDGGLFMKKGGHNTAKGIMRDMEKANALIHMGWVLLRFTPAQVRKGIAIKKIREFLELRKATT